MTKHFLSNSENSGFSLKNIKKTIKRSLWLPFVLVILVVFAAAYFALSNIMNISSGASTDGRVDIKKALAQQTLGKTFAYPLKDQEGNEVSRLQFQILNAELRDQIVVKGQRGTAVKGRLFLIVNLKITNSYDKAVKINTRDYFRLVKDGSNERLAPEIHNDPVEVQAISTKYTRVGFPINENERNLTLQIGEINGDKQLIKLDL